MWRFLDSILGLIFEFIHWLVFVKLTNWEKERLRRMGVESQEELDELVRQRCEARTSQISPEQEAEFLRRHPQVIQVSRSFKNDQPLTASLHLDSRDPSAASGSGFTP
jgi:hypothetical protein